MPISFAAKTDYVIAVTPKPAGANTVAVGDINGDGNVDLLSANRNLSQTASLLGKGDGTFSAPVFGKSLLSGVQPYSATLVDVNNDKILDIITTDVDPNMNTVLVLLGKGNGVFATSAVSSKVGTAPYVVKTGDWNGDGKLDMVTANFSNNTVTISKGDGTGAFTMLSTMNVGKEPNDLAVADVDKDGKTDILVLNGTDNTVSVLLGNGTGAFTTKTTVTVGATPQALAVGDVNNDGKLDFVTANFTPSNVSVLLGSGTGTFSAGSTIAVGAQPLSVAMADVNGDNNLDIVTANFGKDTVSVLEGKGDGTFAAEVPLNAGVTPIFVTLSDVNADNKADIVVVNGADSSSLSVLLNTSGTSSASSLSGTSGADNLVGTSGNDTLKGLDGNDTLKGLAGNDVLDGGLGLDTVVYSSARANFTVLKTTTGYTVTDNKGAEGVDTLVNVDKISFADTAMLFDTVGIPGQAYRVYKAAFDRVPDLTGLGFWINAMDKGASLQSVADGFVKSAEFTTMYGTNPTPESFITQLYTNVLHRAYEQAGFDFWVKTLKDGTNSQAAVLAQFSESFENQTAVINIIGNGIEFTPFA